MYWFRLSRSALIFECLLFRLKNRGILILLLPDVSPASSEPRSQVLCRCRSQIPGETSGRRSSSRPRFLSPKSKRSNAYVLLNACKDICLAVKTGKTKYMEIGRHRGMIANAHINSYEKVKTFKYLGSLSTNQNSIQEEIKCRLKAGNSCFIQSKHSCLIDSSLRF